MGIICWGKRRGRERGIDVEGMMDGSEIGVLVMEESLLDAIVWQYRKLPT